MSCIKCQATLRAEWLWYVARLRAKHGKPRGRVMMCEICLLRAILENPEKMLASDDAEEK